MPTDQAEPKADKEEIIVDDVPLYPADSLLTYYLSECGHSFNQTFFNNPGGQCSQCQLPLKIKTRHYRSEEIINGLLTYLDDTTLNADINKHISSFPLLVTLSPESQQQTTNKIIEILEDPIENVCHQHYKINSACGHSIPATQSINSKNCPHCREPLQLQGDLTLNRLLKNLFNHLEPRLEEKNKLELEYEEILLSLIEINLLTEKVIIINDDEENEKMNREHYDQRFKKVHALNEAISQFINKYNPTLKETDHLITFITYAFEYSYDNIFLMCLPVINNAILKKILIEKFSKIKFFHQKNYFMFKKIFQKLSSDLINLSYQGDHFIFYLISINESRILASLLSVDKNLALLNNRYFEPAVTFAVKIDALDCLRALLNAGASPNVCYNERPALHEAIMRNLVDTVICLAQFMVDINQPNQYGQTPIQIAIRYSRIEIFSFLKQLGAKLELTDKDGNNAYHFAAMNPNIQFISAFLQENYQLDDFNGVGKLPIHSAIDKKNFAVFKKILEKFPQQIMAKNNGVTTLEQIIQRNEGNILQWILVRPDIKKYFANDYGIIEKIFFMADKSHNTKIISLLINDARFTLNHIGKNGIILKTIFSQNENLLEIIANVYKKNIIPDYKFFMDKILSNPNDQKEKLTMICNKFFSMLYVRMAELTAIKIKTVNLFKNHFLIQQNDLEKIITNQLLKALNFDELSANMFIFRPNGLYAATENLTNITLYKQLAISSINTFKESKNILSSINFVEGSH